MEIPQSGESRGRYPNRHSFFDTFGETASADFLLSLLRDLSRNTHDQSTNTRLLETFTSEFDALTLESPHRAERTIRALITADPEAGVFAIGRQIGLLGSIRPLIGESLWLAQIASIPAGLRGDAVEALEDAVAFAANSQDFDEVSAAIFAMHARHQVTDVH